LLSFAARQKIFETFKWIALCIFLILTTACSPPGEPGPQSEEIAAPSDFKNLYAGNCSGCHGADGRKGPGRVLNDPLYLNFAPKESIRHILVYGRPGSLMPPWAKSQGGPLSDADITTLVDGMENDWKKPFDPHGSAIPSYDGAGLTGDPANGKKLFARNCYACHAKGGVAGPINDASYLSLSTNQNLRTSIVVGRPDFPKLPMPNYTILNSGHALKDQDVADLVSYLSSLRPPASIIAKLEMQQFEQSKKAGPEQNSTSSTQKGEEVRHQ